MTKTKYIIGGVIIVALVMIVAGIYRFNFTDGGDVLPDTNENETPLTETQARVIAEQNCIKGGEALGTGTHNKGTQTWWFDANLNAKKEGCNPACVVDEVTKTAEINWRCTGLILPK
jgi:hypothetical protein